MESESMSYQELLLTSKLQIITETKPIVSHQPFTTNSISFRPTTLRLRSVSGQQQLNSSTAQPINSSTHQPINPSTAQPLNPSTPQPIITLSNYHINKLPQCQTNLN